MLEWISNNSEKKQQNVHKQLPENTSSLVFAWFVFDMHRNNIVAVVYNNNIPIYKNVR